MAQQRPKMQAERKEGPNDFKFTKKFSCDNFPSKSAGTKGPIVWVLPAEPAWKWFMPRELDSGN